MYMYIADDKKIHMYISDDKIPLVLTFHPFNYKVRDVISRNFLILKNDPETSAIFTNNPPISFRRNKNMQDNLVHSALRQNLPAPVGTFSCSCARCYTCSFLKCATSISGPKSNFVIRQFYMHLLQHHLLHFLQ